MINTVSYNKISLSDLKDLSSFKNELSEFVKQGGKADLPVADDDKIVPFFEWFSNRFPSNPEFFLELVDDGLISNPFSFEIDFEKSIVNDATSYGLYWMSQNIDKYKSRIVEAIAELARKMDDMDWGDGFEADSALGKYRFHSIRYNNRRYDGKCELGSKNPLLALMTHFHDGDVTKAVLTNSKKISDFLKKPENSETLMKGMYRLQFGMIDDAYATHYRTLYDFGVAPIPDEEYVQKILESMFSEAIWSKDDDFILKHANDFDFTEADAKKQSSSDLFLKKARTSDTVKILLKLGAKTFVKSDIYGNSFFFDSETPCDVLEAVLDFDPKTKDLLFSEPKLIERVFFSESRPDIDKVRLLVEKYGLNLSQINPFSMTKHMDDEKRIETVETLISLGADPRNCRTLIANLVDSGNVKNMRRLHKSGTLNMYYPDPLAAFLSMKHTKNFYEFFDKAPNESFSRLTKNGVPAWFYAIDDSYAPDLVRGKNIDLNQRAANGMDYPYHCAKSKTWMKSFSNIVENIKKRNPGFSFDMDYVDPEGNNALHVAFLSITGDKGNASQSYFDMIAENFDGDLFKLISAKNNEGLTVLDYMKAAFESTNWGNVKSSCMSVLKKSAPQMDFETPANKDGIPLYEFVSSNFYKMPELDEAKARWDLRRKMEKAANEKDMTPHKPSSKI